MKILAVIELSYSVVFFYVPYNSITNEELCLNELCISSFHEQDLVSFPKCIVDYFCFIFFFDDKGKAPTNPSSKCRCGWFIFKLNRSLLVISICI